MKINKLLLLIVLLSTSCFAEISTNWLTNNTFNVREVYVKKEMVTTLQFSSVIDSFVVGSLEAIDVSYVNNYTLVIYANNINRLTNLNVKTREGNYVFVVKTLDNESNFEPNLHINIGKLAKQDLEELHKKIKQQENASSFNPAFDYNFEMKIPKICKSRVCNHRKISPNKVWTDGKYTYLDYRTQDGTEKIIPNIQQTISGIDTAVQFDIKNNIIVVKALVKNLSISSNGEYVCIQYTGDKYEAY